MAFSSKILGQQNPGAALTALYTCPNGTFANGTVHICNTSNATKTYRVSVAVAGEADATKQYLAYDVSLAANTFAQIPNVNVRATDVIRVFGQDNTVTFQFLGSESN